MKTRFNQLPPPSGGWVPRTPYDGTAADAVTAILHVIACVARACELQASSSAGAGRWVVCGRVWRSALFLGAYGEKRICPKMPPAFFHLYAFI
jgi:hypothetical protein